MNNLNNLIPVSYTHLDVYKRQEQQYKITVGYIIENCKSVPYKIFYTDEQTNKRTEIPSKNVTIQHISCLLYTYRCV